MNRTPDFDEIARLMLDEAHKSKSAEVQESVDRFLVDFFKAPAMPPIISPYTPKRRNILQRFLNWLFGLRRVELPKTEEGWFTSKKPKRENNDEQMVTIDELFEPDWDAKLAKLADRHRDNRTHIKQRHARELHDLSWPAYAQDGLCPYSR